MRNRLVFRECSNPKCRLRYPDFSLDASSEFCPNCGELTIIVEDHEHIHPSNTKVKRYDQLTIAVVLDNVRSAYNVGSIIRTCDVFKISQVVLCGITSTPSNPKVLKTSLGAEKNLHISNSNNCTDVIVQLKSNGFFTLGLETSPTAIALNDFTQSSIEKIALILGSEKSGVDPGVLSLCDLIAQIPMQGIKESLNVTVACGIALHHLYNSVRINSK